MNRGVIAAVDAAYDSCDTLVACAAVAWHPGAHEVVERHIVVSAGAAPYIPGRFAEREGELCIAALRALRVRPAVVLCDGHGRAHPLRQGLACVVARVTGWPTIGCAKSLLCGRAAPVGPERGAWAEVEVGGEVVGRVVRTRATVRPVYVSVGDYLDLETAMDVVLLASPRFRIPEPLRIAHVEATSALHSLLAQSSRRE
ncbi:MAG: endonuclease V [Candidatus Binatia bacterium]|nr:MAG: endonuclease V [Candidatus Binatia bacterium]